MKVFLSHSTSPYDASTPARLRAVAAAYGIQILLPERNGRTLVNAETRGKIAQSDAVVALVTNHASQVNNVNEELKVANSFNKAIISLAESQDLILNVPKNQIVIFDRQDPIAHEQQLMDILTRLQQKKKAEENFKLALFTLAGIGLGLLALSSLSTDEE